MILPAGDAKIGKFDWNVALNASPVLLERINDLPVKKTNGTIIYLHDVAYVHEGSPPQTNMVRVNGVKRGADDDPQGRLGLDARCYRRHQVAAAADPARACRAGLDLRAVGDQSIFVKAAIFGVLREAVLAAGLVGLMILLFLGSWRSTIIIIISIPLSILFSVVCAGLARRDHQRHDPWRPGACSRHAGR